MLLRSWQRNLQLVPRDTGYADSQHHFCHLPCKHRTDQETLGDGNQSVLLTSHSDNQTWASSCIYPNILMPEAFKNNMAVFYGNLEMTKEKRNHTVGLCNPGVNALACGGKGVRSSRTFPLQTNTVLSAGALLLQEPRAVVL